MNFGYEPLSDYWRIRSPIEWVVFPFCWRSPLLCRNFLVWCSPICLTFVSLVWEDISEKLLVWEISEILLTMCSCMIFMVSSLTFEYLTHFEFIHMYGIRRWSSSFLVFLYISVQLSQNQFLNELSLSHCLFLPPLSNIDCKGVGLFLGSLFYSLIYVSVFMTVPCCFDYYGLVV